MVVCLSDRYPINSWKDRTYLTKVLWYYQLDIGFQNIPTWRRKKANSISRLPCVLHCPFFSQTVYITYQHLRAKKTMGFFLELHYRLTIWNKSTSNWKVYRSRCYRQNLIYWFIISQVIGMVLYAVSVVFRLYDGAQHYGGRWRTGPWGNPRPSLLSLLCLVDECYIFYGNDYGFDTL